jgi:hypothetical protein
MGLLLWILMSATSLYAASEDNKKWSFNFSNTSISDVLDELTHITGVYIVSNQLPSNKTVTKRYENQTIDKIIKDLFRGLNFSLVWHQTEQGVDALDIWVFDSASGKSGGFSTIERPVTRTPNRPVRYERKTPRPVEQKDEGTEEADDDENDSPSESSELDDESEKEDAASDDDSGKEPAAIEEDEPDDESDEKTEEGSPVPIKNSIIE